MKTNQPQASISTQTPRQLTQYRRTTTILKINFRGYRNSTKAYIQYVEGGLISLLRGDPVLCRGPWGHHIQLYT